MHHTQIAIALSRERRLAILENVDFERAGLTRREWANLAALIEAIEVSTDRDGQAAAPTLATKCRMSERTLRRTASSGRRAGVLFSRHTYDDQGRSSNEWRVAWDRLAVLAGSKTPTASSGHVGQNLAKLAGTGTVLAGTHYFPVRENNTTPSLPGYLAQQLAGTDADWRRQEEVLFSLGIDRAAVAIAAARAAGVTPGQIDELVAYWRSKGGGTIAAAYGPAALCWRIQNARPNMPADRHWPTASDAWNHHQRQQQEREAAAKRERNRLERRREQEAHAAEPTGPGMLEQFRAAIAKGSQQ